MDGEGASPEAGGKLQASRGQLPSQLPKDGGLEQSKPTVWRGALKLEETGTGIFWWIEDGFSSC